MADWQTNEEGYVVAVPLAGYSLALTGDGDVLAQLRVTQPGEGEGVTALQLVLTPEQCRDLAKALMIAAEDPSAKQEGPSSLH